MSKTRVCFNVSTFLGVATLLFYSFSVLDDHEFRQPKHPSRLRPARGTTERPPPPNEDYNVWLIFTKVVDGSPLMYHFGNLLMNLLNVSSAPLRFNVIADGRSARIAEREIARVANGSKKVDYVFYDVRECAESIRDIFNAMSPYFSSGPGTYYSDALFYLSLGLYRFAPLGQNVAVMIDCDVYFKDDIVKLFRQIENFEEGNLFGLAPELSPVYRHILYGYRQRHNTTFGEFHHSERIADGVHPHGFQGYNSGVVLFNLSAIRASSEYREVIKKETVAAMTAKYKFRGHLGDQDFYTLLGYERPHLFRTLSCGFNRQLCTWWGDKGGYRDVFDDYFRCNSTTVVLHGNCNTRLPTS